ncbi:TonB family protein [Methylobacterium nodulans]|uniref:TonB family protein n=1 Tax=Methylobacterium nodulans (strain LMG 21967 / CNCM I-2342 / ORS 2060) TaxID=460265 RepID=B8IM52_METNO|nr:TonB family protein [Methylobacterium nodulans]ACL56396.1 TonB family protein [Methylobacterium nodulans ORS 2060]
MTPRATLQGPDQPGPGLALAFLVAFALHVGAIGAITLWRSAPPTSGENEITIDLAPSLEAIEVPNDANDTISTPPPAELPAEQKTAEPPAETRMADTPPDLPEVKPQESPVETPQPMTEAVPPEAVEPKPAEAVQAVELPPEDQVITSTNEAAPLAPPPPAVVARPVEEPKPEPKPVLKPVEKPKPKPVEQVRKPPPPKPVREATREAVKPRAAERSTEPARQRRAAATASRANAGGSAAAPSANPNALRAWGQQISGAIRARVRSPGAGGGTVTIRFTVARSGRVMSASLISSSGNSSLDAAALAAAAPGSSLPPAPADVTVAQQSFSVPLAFR